MADKTGIEWTDTTWSPVTGCTRTSPGCDHCYIERTPPFRMAHRRFDGEGVGSTTGVLLHPERLMIPFNWRKPRKVFVCSMADLFHDQVPDDYIAKVWAVMACCPDHTFQVLTKRHARLRSLLSGDFRDQVAEEISDLMGRLPGTKYKLRGARLSVDRTTDDGWNIWGPSVWPLPNVWVGVSAENQQWAEIRIPALRKTPAAVRFVSAEPLLGPIDLLGDADDPGPAVVRTGVQTRLAGPWGPAEYDYDDQVGIDWVIAGGESGPGSRPMHPDWARGLRDQCENAGVAFLFKQHGEWSPQPPAGAERSPGTYVSARTHGGGCLCDQAPMWRVGKHRAGRELDGRTWDQYPEAVV